MQEFIKSISSFVLKPQKLKIFLSDDEETDKWLYNYLFYSKNRVEKAKKHLEFYFTCKSKLPELYGDRDPAGKGIQDSAKVL